MSCTEQCHKPRGRQAHCSVCHRTFTGLTSFDDHRVRGECTIEAFSETNGVWRDTSRGVRPAYWSKS